jgi:hypothetical protein
LFRLFLLPIPLIDYPNMQVKGGPKPPQAWKQIIPETIGKANEAHGFCFQWAH